jgi:hypothetical protein
MAWDTAIADIRAYLSDGAKDKYRFRKKVFGEIDGNNTRFKTLEIRRITDFTSSDLPEGVFVNGELATVSEDSVETGDFIMQDAPTEGQRIEASYYSQYFLDEELNKFLQNASNWLSLGPQYVNIQPGLVPAAIQFAAGDAYRKLAMKFAEHQSEQYRVEDSQDPKRLEIVAQYEAASKAAYEQAKNFRNEFYTRAGQPLQPLFLSLSGAVQDPQPKR